MLAWQHEVGAEVAGELNKVDKEANSQTLVFADSLYITVLIINQMNKVPEVVGVVLCFISHNVDL